MTGTKRPRILHLIDPQGSLVGPCALAMLADLAASGAARRVDLLAMILGGARSEAMAHHLGVATFDRMSAFGGRAWLGVSPLRRYLAAVGPVDLIHCWSPATLALATLTAPALPRLLTLAAHPLSASQGQWVRMLAAHGSAPTTILAASNCVKRAWAQAGVEPALMHVLRPGLDLSRLDAQRRASLRREWCVHSERTAVVAVLSQYGPCIDALPAAHVLGSAILSGLDVAFICPADASRRPAARRIARGCGVSDRLVFDRRLDRPWMVLPGCDIALVLGNDTSPLLDARRPARAALAIEALFGRRNHTQPGRLPGVLPLLWAAAAGKTIIAEAGYAVAEIVENGKTALVVKPGDGGAVVERLREILADSQRAWSLRDAARSEAFSFFSVSRYAQAVVDAYEQVLTGTPVRIADLPLTGGLAFAGRS
ncbi:MAG: glycosyltransferase [Phycisphaerales bacterium]|nr:glycosyltransferase [Phycisphaerales bacterium]